MQKPKQLIKNYLQRTINSCQHSGKRYHDKVTETTEHYLKKAEVLDKYVNHGWSVMSECKFKKGRADLVCWLKLGENYIYHFIEILHSERESNLKNKKEYYPKGNNILLRYVKTSDNLDTFDI